MKAGLPFLQTYNERYRTAQIYFEHYRIFRKGLLFLNKNYKVIFKGSYEIIYLQFVFFNIFNSTDGGFEFLSKFCDEARKRAVTKELTEYPLLNIKNLEFLNQISVLKRALCKRSATIKIEKDLLEYVPYSKPEWIQKTIRETFCRIPIQKNFQFSSTKSCLQASAQCGGSFAILQNDLKQLPIYNEFITHYQGEFEINPTIWHIIKHTPTLRKELNRLCFRLTDQYHDCADPVNCTEWDEKHPACLITQVSFRGGKVRPLTIFSPEINYLGSRMKNVFKEVLKQNANTDLFLHSKYYYEEIIKNYKPDSFMHSGDLKSCTNRFNPKVSRDILWDVWTYVTGNKSLKYHRILTLCFSYFKLVEKDLELIHIREKAPIELKRELFSTWLKKASYIKQLNGQHMGMSLSFWMMGVMHALTTNHVYKSPVPRITATDLYRLRVGLPIHKDKVDPKGDLYKYNATLRGHYLRPGVTFSFGDDHLHLNEFLKYIHYYRNIIEEFNQEWSNKGDFITKEGCVFTERVLTRKGDTLVPLVAIKSKLLFPEIWDKRPYTLESLKNIWTSMDQEYNVRFCNSMGIYFYKYINLAKRIMFERFSKLKNKLPIHVGTEFGGFGMPGQWTKRDYKWLRGLYQISKGDDFTKTWKRLKKDIAPEMTEVKREYAKVYKTHTGSNFYFKDTVRRHINKLISPSENLINLRPKIQKDRNLDDYFGAYQRILNKIKLKSFERNSDFSLKRLKYNLVDRSLVGIDDDLNLALDYRNKYDFMEVTRDYKISDLLQVKKIIKNGLTPESLLDVYNYLYSYFKSSIKKLSSIINNKIQEYFPFEYKSSFEALRNFETKYPFVCIIIGKEDNGKNHPLPKKMGLAHRDFIFWPDSKEKGYFYKIIETPFSKLNTRQRKFLKAIIFSSSQPGKEKEDWFDFSVTVPSSVKSAQVTYDEQDQLTIESYNELTKNKWRIQLADKYLFKTTKGNLLSIPEQKLILFKLIENKYSVTCEMQLLDARYHNFKAIYSLSNKLKFVDDKISFDIEDFEFIELLYRGDRKSVV